MMERVRKEGRGSLTAGWAILLALALGLAAHAEDPCTKLPDLWFPSPGTLLARNGIAVQEATAGVCQGGRVEVTITVDNMTCGDAGPFDVSLFYDSYDSGHRIGTKRVDSLLGCEYVKLTFSWDTSSVAPGTHDLLAWADVENKVKELSETNNQYTLPTDVLVSPFAPLIEATKALREPSDGAAAPGEKVTFEIRIWNDGCADQRDNAGNEFSDAIPAGLQNPKVMSATSGRASVEGDSVVWNGSLPAHGSVTIVLEATVDPATADGTEICNQGIAHYDGDTNGSNESEEPTDDPSTGVDDDPTCLHVRVPLVYTPIAGTIDAPTMTEWGAIAFGSLLSVAFLVMLVRRRRLIAAARKDPA